MAESPFGVSVGVAAEVAEVGDQELVRSTGHRRPRVSGFLTLVSPLRFFLAQTMSVSPRLCSVRW